jgi:hypothetical protein
MFVSRPIGLYLVGISVLSALMLNVGAFGDTIFKNSFEGTHIVVTNAEDSGPGTLRQALLEAQKSDIITFDPTVFPPSAPVTISITSPLEPIDDNHFTLDASNAGVVLDGSLLPDEWLAFQDRVFTSAGMPETT